MRTSSFLMDYSIEDENTGRVTPALAAQVSVTTGRSVNVAYDYAAGQSIPIPPEWRAKIKAFEQELRVIVEAARANRADLRGLLKGVCHGQVQH
jgi:hypothetical protein